MSPSQVEQLAARFRRTWLRSPTEDELARLIEGHVRDEVYYREALAMGLDQDDPVVRQRMRLKLEFLLEELTAEDPDDKVLAAYLQQHPDEFWEGPRVSFRQLYLDPEKNRDLTADAQHMLASLNRGMAPESVGDPTLLQRDYTMATQGEIARLFGKAFAQDVVELALGAWTGPLYSGNGGHLVLVTERSAGRLPELAEVRERVAREYLAQRRQELMDKTYQSLRAGYEVVIESMTTSDRMASEAMAAYRADEAGR